MTLKREKFHEWVRFNLPGICQNNWNKSDSDTSSDDVSVPLGLAKRKTELIAAGTGTELFKRQDNDVVTQADL